jgi:hypothetical protein
MDYNESWSTDSLLIKSCPAMVLIVIKMHFRLDIFHFRIFFTDVSARKYLNTTTRKASHKQMREMNKSSSFASELFLRAFI